MFQRLFREEPLCPLRSICQRCLMSFNHHLNNVIQEATLRGGKVKVVLSSLSLIILKLKDKSRARHRWTSTMWIVSLLLPVCSYSSQEDVRNRESHFEPLFLLAKPNFVERIFLLDGKWQTRASPNAINTPGIYTTIVTLCVQQPEYSRSKVKWVRAKFTALVSKMKVQ